MGDFCCEEAMQSHSGGIREAIYDCVRQIPAGDVMSYGEVARRCGTVPILVGKALAFCPEDVPWHRVVGAGGVIRLERRGAAHAAEQRHRLAAEGITFLEDGRVDFGAE
jgi:methylated-DNA-protein-cysteine methyltransferase-like protein